jgi:hypothetical protein
MSLDLEVIDGFRDYLGIHPLLVNHDDPPADIKTKIQDENSVQEAGGGESGDTDESPANRGRIIQLPPGRLTTDELLLPQSQSLRGVKGSTILTLDSTSTLTDRTNNDDKVAAYVTIGGEFRVRAAVAGQGVIEDLDIDATYTEETLPNSLVALHGLYAPPREGNTPPNDSANVHTIRNVGVYNAFSNGIHFDQGNDKLVCDRLRSEGAGGIGIYLAGGDVKARALASTSDGPALKVSGAAVEIDQLDLWRPDELLPPFNKLPTLDIKGGFNGCVIKSGTVEGWTRFKGNNEDATASKRFANSKAQFAFVHFKYRDDLARDTPSCYFEAQSADLVELISCKFGASGYDPIDPELSYDYLIIITNSEGEQGDGMVKITGGSGMVRYLGRVDGTENRMRIDAKKHICNMPWRLLFDWGRMGTVEMVPPWAVGQAVDVNDPLLRSHLRCDGKEYFTADYPFAYLNVAAYNEDWDATLESPPLKFTMPDLPSLSQFSVPAIRAIP